MSAPSIHLRPYQREAIASVLNARRAGVRRMVLSLPTGAGKTVVFAELARRARRPVLVLAHRRELVVQARDKIARALGDSSLVGIEQGQERAPTSARIVVASIRSLGSDRLESMLEERRFGLIVYDECHHAPAEDNLRVLRQLGVFDADWDGTLLGVTATTARGDGEGLDQVFEQIVYRCTIGSLVSAGYLAPLRGFRIATSADLVSVGAGVGDFVIEELAEAVDIDSRNALVARSIQELARDRRTIAFCVTVAHARHLARSLNAIGVATGIVHGEMRPEARRDTLEQFRSGRLSAVTNVGVLTEGFDDPGVSCIAIARPTRSAGLYAQCVGRGTRTARGKRDCLVLDFVDASKLSLVTLPTLVGLPANLDLEGSSLDEAERALQLIWDDNPGFEVDPESITLGEIKGRAEAFDPLKLAISDEVRAVSANCWQSLGSRGLGLHLYWGDRAARKDVLSEILLLDQYGRPGVSRRSKRWRVTLDGKEMARFTRIEEAVEAVDYEVSQRGRKAAESARPGASWRSEPVPSDFSLKLDARPENRGEALRLSLYHEYGPRSPRRQR